LAVTACVVLASCASARIQKDLACHCAELRDAGKLPGLPPDAHGRFRTEGARFGERVTYPFSRRVYLTQEHDPATYTYSFTKDTSAAPWRLTAAWRTLPDGQREDLKIE
jgi:hypothetical protein